MAKFEEISQNFAGRTEETEEIPELKSCCLGRDSNWAFLQYKLRSITARGNMFCISIFCSVLFIYFNFGFLTRYFQVVCVLAAGLYVCAVYP